jgi:hypothetical protein
VTTNGADSLASFQYQCGSQTQTTTAVVISATPGTQPLSAPLSGLRPRTGCTYQVLIDGTASESGRFETPAVPPSVSDLSA